MQEIDRIKQLTYELNDASKKYYNTGTSPLSDVEFDIKLEELKSLEKQYNFSMSNSPVHKVGYEVITEQEKVTHTVPMLSLEKVHETDEIIDFSEGKKVIAMEKMDGISLRAIFSGENGNLIGLESRGNGVEGSDLFYQRFSFDNLPLHIDVTEDTIIDGEAIIDNKSFEEINSVLPEDKKYSHSRNLAAGSLALLDTNISSKRHLKMVAWDVIKGNDSDSFSEKLDWIHDKGFDIVSYIAMTDLDKDDTNSVDYTNELIFKFAEERGHNIDGVVWKYDSVSYGKTKGRTDKFFCNAVAWKPAMKAYETTLRNIVWETSKTGRINPICIVDPVDLDGAITSRCTLNNLSYIEDLELGIGDKVQIIRSNFVIPKIIGNLTRSNTYKPIDKCPCCGGDVEITNNNGSKFIYCTNPDCSAKLLSKLVHFVSKNCADIDGLSEATLDKFIDLGWINNFVDIYKLENHKVDIASLSGFGIKSANKIIKAIEESKNIKLPQFINSLSISSIGKVQSKLIAAKFKTWDAFEEAMRSGYDFSQIDTFGDITNNKIHDWYSNIFELEKIPELLDYMNIEQEEVSSNNKLDGKSFCITGKLVHYANRDELVKVIEDNGGKYVSGVSAKTDYLINNNKASTSGKNKKMIDMDKMDQIISEDDFIEMIQ